MRRDPAAEPRRLGRHVADTVEFTHRYRQEWIPTWGNSQPLDRHCNHHARSSSASCGDSMACQRLVAFAHLDTDQHALRIDVADPQHDDFAAAQTGPVGDAERGLVLETGTGRGLDQPGNLIR